MHFLKSKEMSETEMKFFLPVFSFGGLGFLFFMNIPVSKGKLSSTDLFWLNK